MNQPGAPQGYSPRGQSDDQMRALLAYILSLVAAIIAPLVIYLVKKNESGYVRYHAAQALNLGITGTIYAIALIIIAIPFGLLTHGFGFILIFLAFAALSIAHLVFLILGAVRSNQGELYRIPAFLCFPMVR